MRTLDTAWSRAPQVNVDALFCEMHSLRNERNVNFIELVITMRHSRTLEWTKIMILTPNLPIDNITSGLPLPGGV